MPGLKYEHGLAQFFDPSVSDPVIELPTTQCCHCGCHFPLPQFDDTPLAKKLRIGRGFCHLCDAYICGEKCSEHKPTERWLEEQEGTKDPTAVSAIRGTAETVTMPPPLWIPPGAK